MDHEEQVKVVERALELEKEIGSMNDHLDRLKSQAFRAAPQPPVRQIAKQEEIADKAKVKVNWLLLLLPIFVLMILTFATGRTMLSAFIGLLFGFSLLVWPWIYFLGIRRKKKASELERIKNSPEYKKQCADAIEKAQREQAAYDAQYSREMDEYKNSTIPKYNAEKEKWASQHNAAIQSTEDVLTKDKAELSKLYAESSIVPKQYRHIEALEYIYDMISTSDYEVRQAIDSYDKSKQRELELERLKETRLQNELAIEQNELAMQQNELLDRQNEIADKTRRDNNIAAIVTAAQRHNLNKYVKGRNK